MKTTTILSAYLKAESRRMSVFANRRRQADKFGAALLSRIEAGDRALEVLDKMINTKWSEDDGPVDMFCKLDEILIDYAWDRFNLAGYDVNEEHKP